MRSTASSSMFTHHTPHAMIWSLDDNVPLRSGDINDVLRMLRSTINLEELKAFFPRRSEERPSAPGQQCRFALHPDYASHLASVMRQSSDAINGFLRAAGAKRLFSYGSSKFYENQTFEKVLHHEWPAPTIAWSFEKRLLQRIATAYKILKHLLRNTGEVPDLGMCRSVHTSFTILGKYPVRISPDQEDARWTSEVADLVQAVLNLTTPKSGAKRLSVIALTRPLCATSPTSSSIPECRLPTAEASTQPRDTDCVPSPQIFRLLVPKDMQLSATPQPERRSPDCSPIPESCRSKTYVKTEQHAINELRPQLQPTRSIIMPCQSRMAESNRQLQDAYKATEPRAKNKNQISRSLLDMPLDPKAASQETSIQPLRDPDKATTKLGIMSCADTIMSSRDQEDHSSQLYGSETHQEDPQRLHRISARLSRKHNASLTTKASAQQAEPLSSPGPLHSPDSQHLMASEDSYPSPTHCAAKSQADTTNQLRTSRLLALPDTRIANQEPTIQLPHDPDKNAPTTLTQRLNPAEFSTAQDTPAHPEDRLPPSTTFWMAGSAEKSHDTTTAQKVTSRVPDQPVSEGELPATAEEPSKLASVIRPLRDPDKTPVASHPTASGTSDATASSDVCDKVTCSPLLLRTQKKLWTWHLKPIV